ncbi:proteasome assembly chaperone 2-like [Cimex lectularius]|uniref:Proteasome assembly chaperone 2 n=1 Tax=Cimex lectularius TaxID=79782 RepID=A0A8I6RDX7_CIMLE|nr:proteasome assembly chaperone 2-like [Cimex lectularius]
MFKHFERTDFEGFTAVIASPSVGNVGQLSLDLIISSLKAEYVGMIWHKGVLPFVGADPYNESSHKLCSSNDVYLCKKNKLLLMQLRSPLHRSQFVDYCTQIVDSLKAFKVDRVVLLSGMYAHQRDDSELRVGTFRYLSNVKGAESFNLGRLEWTRIKGSEMGQDYSCPRLPGAGFTRTFYNICTQSGLPCVALLYFCSEGDNIQDSLTLTIHTDECLNVLPDRKNIVQPPSWKYLFGNSVPQEIY